MKGYKVLRKAGWDTHGLPVELEVEKMLGLDGKEQIEKYGLEPFIKHCKESVWKYKGMWEDFSNTVGFWADMDDPYVTYHNDFIESEWWALKQIWDKGLLYKGFKIVPYCPRCGTPLSSHEVAQGYKNVKERSAVVRFKVVGEDAYFLNSANIKNRQPIGTMFVKSHTELNEFFKAIIAEELNVKNVEFKDDVKELTSYSFKPQLRTLGPKYGKFIGEIRNALAEIDGNAAMDELNANGVLKLQLSNITAELEREDLLIETAQVEGFESASDYGITVVLDTNLTPELVEEGFVREVISKIQTMRKDSGYEVMDHIVLYHSGNDKIKEIIANNKDEIMEDVLADDIKFDTECDNQKSWDINGEKVTLGLQKL